MQGYSLTLLGIVGLQLNLEESAHKAIKRLDEANLQTRIVSFDQSKTIISLLKSVEGYELKEYDKEKYEVMDG